VVGGMASHGVMLGGTIGVFLFTVSGESPS
jgi:prolipoprotein diacylglyceryltransferase